MEDKIFPISTFEEEFPSLAKLKGYTLNLNNLPIDVCFEGKNSKRVVTKRVLNLFRKVKKAIQKHCLDKQKVGEVLNHIEKQIDNIDLYYNFGEKIVPDARKILGLESEGQKEVKNAKKK